MSSSSDDHCRGRQFMVAGDLAPLVAEFTRHLSQEGYTDLTVRGFDHAARHLAHWLGEAGITVAEIDEAVVARFARHRCRCPGGRRTKQLSAKYVRRVRRFVAFLAERGIAPQKRTPAAPVPDRRVVEFQDWLRRHRGLSKRTIELHGHLLMRLLPTLGARPRSWDAQHIREVIETRLPLPQDVGDAVLAYLERARPRVESDRVFFMLNAPIRPLVDSRAVTGIVRGAIRKAGIDAPTKGASLLRHSAATAMLRGGATLDMVGAVLRHRSPDMTAHYAKVDVTMLRQIAQPWPGDA